MYDTSIIMACKAILNRDRHLVVSRTARVTSVHKIISTICRRYVHDTDVYSYFTDFYSQHIMFATIKAPGLSANESNTLKIKFISTLSVGFLIDKWMPPLTPISCYT